MIYTRTDIIPYLDGLTEIIPDKLMEILTEMDELELERENYLRAIKKVRQVEGVDDIRDYIATLDAELGFSRYFVLQKELDKWLRLEELLRDEPLDMLPRSTSQYSAVEIEKAKKRSIEEFYEGRLRQSGMRLFGKCPFHEERTGSFVIYTENNTYHCFGCGANGDVIDFVQAIKKISFKEALEVLL